MDIIIFVFVGMMCLMLGVRVFFSEEQNKIFTKYPIQVTDVKKYNHFCGALILGFGVVAEVTFYFMISSEGWLSTVLTLLIVVEAVVVMGIYREGEKRFIKKR